MEQYAHYDVDELRSVLLGRQIVEAEITKDYDKLPREIAAQLYMSDSIGVLTLDNGMQLFIEPNVGCGGCTSGWFSVTKVAKVTNAITGIRIEYTDKDGYDTKYRLFVITDNAELSALEVEGTDGSGYYGTGFDVYVLPMIIDGSVVDNTVPAIEWKSVES